MKTPNKPSGGWGGEEACLPPPKQKNSPTHPYGKSGEAGLFFSSVRGIQRGVYIWLISEEVSSLSRKRRDMHHSPARPTRVKMILLKVAACPPKSQPTKSNLNKPTEPQFNAPMITSINDVLSSILSSPENRCFFTSIKSRQNRSPRRNVCTTILRR